MEKKKIWDNAKGNSSCCLEVSLSRCLVFDGCDYIPSMHSDAVSGREDIFPTGKSPILNAPSTDFLNRDGP